MSRGCSAAMQLLVAGLLLALSCTCAFLRLPVRTALLKTPSPRRMAANEEAAVLRQVDKWACISNCGACCKLGPLDERPDLATYLSTEELQTYVSMIGADNWCVNYDKVSRMCNVYETRPEFCRVEPAKFKTMFDVEEEELNEFCRFCCEEQISDSYGEDSPEMIRFLTVMDSLDDDGEEIEGGQD